MDFIEFFNNSPMMQDSFEQFEYMTGLDRGMFWPILGGSLLVFFALNIIIPLVVSAAI